VSQSQLHSQEWNLTDIVSELLGQPGVQLKSKAAGYVDQHYSSRSSMMTFYTALTDASSMIMPVERQDYKQDVVITPF
jgi:hypothetical protein